MGITAEPTPNPRAMKFIVGTPVGGTATATSADGADSRIAPLFAIEGVMSVFMTADFVTVSCADGANWDQITPAVITELTTTFA